MEFVDENIIVAALSTKGVAVMDTRTSTLLFPPDTFDCQQQ
jgi:hypothetical protein